MTTGEGMRGATTRLVVPQGTRRFRRWHPVFVVFLVAFLVVSIVWGNWGTVASAALTLLSQLILAAVHHARLIIDEGGITIDDRYRRRHVPWSEVAAVRLRWEHAVRRPALPHIERRDGEELHGSVLSGVGKDDRGAERAALLARLEEAAQQHGFALDVAPPPPRWGSSWKVGTS